MPSQNISSSVPADNNARSMKTDLNEHFLDDSDEDDIGASGFNRHDSEVLGDDPLNDSSGQTTSFKRKQKESTGLTGSSGFSKFLSPFLKDSANSSSAGHSPRRTPNSSNDGRSPDGSSSSAHGHERNDSKGEGPHDWIIEGPGQRVGYEDMTAIDWIFEYTKERQRSRMLYANAAGVIGYMKEMADASQVWIVLVATGIAVGLIAAGIDIASDWLGDIKTGYCSAGTDGGRFYLNKGFCCMGYSEWSQCQDWVPWSKALHVTSGAGKWIVEYLFFITYSVSKPLFKPHINR